MLSEDNAVRVALADFADRRGEIGKRSAEQHALIRLNITAAGVLATLVVARRGDPLLLLVIPPISSALAMFWGNHARAIGHSGDYIYRFIKPVVDPGRGGPLLHWEVFHDIFDKRWKRIASFALPVLLVFMLPAAMALLFTLNEVADRNELRLWVVWGVATAFTFYAGMLLATSGIFAAPSEREPDGDEGSTPAEA